MQSLVLMAEPTSKNGTGHRVDLWICRVAEISSVELGLV
jgi:hypothetical protein